LEEGGKSMQATAEHYHAESRYPGHPDGDEDRAYRDLNGALRQAEENAAALRPNGYVIEQTDTGNDDVGVIREYYIAEEDGTPIATIEVRSCHEEGHI
jgi:hypothetical protein